MALRDVLNDEAFEDLKPNLFIMMTWASSNCRSVRRRLFEIVIGRYEIRSPIMPSTFPGGLGQIVGRPKKLEKNVARCG